MLVNHYSATLMAIRSKSREDWRLANASNNNVHYCLIDFDVSLILPKDVRRLPSTFAFYGHLFFQPPDIQAGEIDYDPYAFDVACLGNVFASEIDVRHVQFAWSMC